MKRLSLPLLALLLLASPALSQIQPEKALSTFTVADGLELSLWASEPLFANPTSIDIDHLGRVWVCESINYRCKLHRQPLRQPAGDRIVILADTDNDGKADKTTVFYQAPELIAPLGIAVAKEPTGPGWKVYVCHSPDILVFEDKDGDGKADGAPKKLLTGFGGYDHDHGVHGITIGPDAKLYFTVGDTGVKNLQSADGKGRKWTSNSTDCRAGTVWRCNQDGTGLELIAHNFRNNYEACVDSFGNIFLSDNDDDGNQQTRICFVMPGGNYGYHPRGPGQSHWHEEQPGVVPKIIRTGFGSPTGICMYEGTLLPEKYRGQIIHADAGPREIRCFHLKPKGAGYDVAKEMLVTSTDNWFRPSDVCVAPDGSIFIADWYDPGVGGHGMGDTTRGRLYRLTPKGHKGYTVPKVKLKTPEQIIEALGSPCLANRALAMGKLAAIDPDHAMITLAFGMMKNPDPRIAIRCYWLLGIRAAKIKPEKRPNEVHYAFLQFMIAAGGEPGLQEHMPRINYAIFGPSGELLKQSKLAKLESDFAKKPAAYRRERLLTLRPEPAEAMMNSFYALAKLYDGKDRFYLEAIGIAVGHNDKKRREIILADFDKHFPDWNDKVADLVWELRPPSIMPRLELLLADAKLTAGQRGRIIDILAASDDTGAGKGLLKALHADQPAAVRDRIVENLKLFLPTKWKSLRASPELAKAIDGLLAKPDGVTAGLQLIAVAGGTSAVARVSRLAVDAKQPESVRREAVQTLGKLPSDQAIDALARLVSIPALRRDAVQALGQMRTDKSITPLKTIVMDDKQKLSLRVEAVAALANSRDGSRWLLEEHANKVLPAALHADAGRLLRNSPYQDLRNKALIAFPAPGRIDPKKLPSIAALAARKGDPNRGKQVLIASVKNDLQCLKCHTVRGLGGQIGPDLSVIGKKASRENLFESVLQPSKAIADQYLTWVVETKDGLALTGLLMEETPTHLTLRDANGKDTKIEKSAVDSRAKSPTSIMPDNLLVHMTEDDLVDMVEYLFALKTPALTFDWWHVIGPFDNGASDAGIDLVFPPEKAIDLKARYPGKSAVASWRTVKPNAQGYVDLQALFAGNSDGIVSYLYREVESPVGQEAVILLGTDDSAKLWVNGEKAFSIRATRAAAPEQDSVKVRLKKGRNPILLKITNGNGPHGFYFTIMAEQELKRVEAK